MSEIIEALKGILKVVAVGVPALLILLGFAAVVGGYTFGIITGDLGMRNFGIGLIILGVIIYLIELALWYDNQR
jgi:predicted MFS family arabinose efflux permease